MNVKFHHSDVTFQNDHFALGPRKQRIWSCFFFFFFFKVLSVDPMTKNGNFKKLPAGLLDLYINKQTKIFVLRMFSEEMEFWGFVFSKGKMVI